MSVLPSRAGLPATGRPRPCHLKIKDLMLRRRAHERLRALNLERAVMRYDLSDNEWRIIREMLPNKPRGVPRVDDRRVLNGIFWVLRSGAPWRDLPDGYGP